MQDIAVASEVTADLPDAPAGPALTSPDATKVARDWAGRFTAARFTSAAFAVVLLAVEAVIVAESWRGLTGFAHLIGIHGPAAWGVPVTLDGVSLIAALVALRAELAGESSGVYRATLFVFTAASAAANYWHGRIAGGTEAALYLGGMSLAVTWVFALVLRQIRHEDRRRAGRVTERLPRFSGSHWTRYPWLTWTAWSLAVRDGHETARAALSAATAARAKPAKPAVTEPVAVPVAAIEAAPVADPGAELEPLPDIPANGVLAAMPKAQAIRIALAHNRGQVIAAQTWLAQRGVLVDRAYAHDVRRNVRGKGRRIRPAETTSTPAPGSGAA